MTNDEIYRAYKHCLLNDLNIPTKRIYNALKSCGLTVFLVTDGQENERVWIYVPEVNTMELVA